MIKSMLPMESLSATKLNLEEWSTYTPESHDILNSFNPLSLKDLSICDSLKNSGRLELIETRSGIQISTTSYVGTVMIGGIAIKILPKINFNYLHDMFRYTYCIHNTKLHGRSLSDVTALGVEDIICILLLEEIRSLHRLGLIRKYVRQEKDLELPRGAIDIQRLTRRGHIGSTLPCNINPRLTNCSFNQLLLAGLNLAAKTTFSSELASECRQLSRLLGDEIATIELNKSFVRRLANEHSRLTVAYKSSLQIVTLLIQNKGINLHAVRDEEPGIEFPGFLFDMNNLFQSVLSRYLRNNLTNFQVHDEYALRGMMSYLPKYNSQNRRPPLPRPDWVIRSSHKIEAILDAKYRDLWAKKLPREMLYQLAIYALAHRTPAKAVILYPSNDDAAKEQRIGIDEVTQGSRMGEVHLRPVKISDLLRFIRYEQQHINLNERQSFANHLVFGG